MATEHVTVAIARSAATVYAYAADPANLVAWAAGLTGATLEQVEGHWVTDSPMGRITIDFAPPNGYGVLDHDVTMPSGERVYNPMRVIADGDGCEVVFTVRQRPGMSDTEFAADTAAVRADLEALRDLLERGGR
jgi:hypothetical protein